MVELTEQQQIKDLAKKDSLYKLFKMLKGETEESNPSLVSQFLDNQILGSLFVNFVNGMERRCSLSSYLRDNATEDAKNWVKRNFIDGARGYFLNIYRHIRLAKMKAENILDYESRKTVEKEYSAHGLSIESKIKELLSKSKDKSEENKIILDISSAVEEGSKEYLTKVRKFGGASEMHSRFIEYEKIYNHLDGFLKSTK